MFLNFHKHEKNNLCNLFVLSVFSVAHKDLNFYKGVRFFNFFFFFKLINKFAIRGGIATKFERAFLYLFLKFKYLKKHSVFFFFKILQKLAPAVAHRKRMRFAKNKKKKLNIEKIPVTIFVKDRRLRKKLKKKTKVRKGKAKHMTRARRYVEPVRNLYTFPWVYSKFRLKMVAVRYMCTWFRKHHFKEIKQKRDFITVIFEGFCSFFQNKYFKKVIFVKRYAYAIIFKTRVGLHFRW